MTKENPSPSSSSTENVRAAQVVVPCRDLEPTLDFFIERLGFQLEAIFPADNPRVAVVSGHGVRVELRRVTRYTEGSHPGVLRLLCDDPRALGGGATALMAPNGTRIELVDADPPVVIPDTEHALVITKMEDGSWGTGRAGMRYRDLIPGRLGGSFIASHIAIPEGGPIPDYVHFHKIEFQMIYVYKGWVRLVYEDQGPPFVMEAGDCVLQPPRIRHRVLECSPGFEVVEIACPAEHETFRDHELTLPTAQRNPDRDFDGQRFVCHFVKRASWEPYRIDGFESRDTGIAEATGGVASARVARATDASTTKRSRHDADFVFLFVLDGAVALESDGDPAQRQRLTPGDSIVLPPETTYGFHEISQDLEFLEVTAPAEFRTLPG